MNPLITTPQPVRVSYVELLYTLCLAMSRSKFVQKVDGCGTVVYNSEDEQH
jgi:hypothetical protein